MALSWAQIPDKMVPRTIKIRMTPDYEYSPLWHESGDGLGDLNPFNLTMSVDLAQALMRWAHVYDATLKMDDPASSGFDSPEEEDIFYQEVVVLARRLQEELGDNYRVRQHFPEGPKT